MKKDKITNIDPKQDTTLVIKEEHIYKDKDLGYELQIKGHEDLSQFEIQTYLTIKKLKDRGLI